MKKGLLTPVNEPFSFLGRTLLLEVNVKLTEVDASLAAFDCIAYYRTQRIIHRLRRKLWRSHSLMLMQR
jgi:hypothetical protein